MLGGTNGEQHFKKTIWEKCNHEQIEGNIEPNELFGDKCLEKQPKNNILEV
jgi:hypothetical protein